MTAILREPAFRIWVQGSPRSMQGDPKRLAEYRQQIMDSARKIVPHPINSPRIDIEIYFCAQTGLRPDVDNIIKPILDSLKGIVYFDDLQVRSIRVASLPIGEVYGILGWSKIDVMNRLTADPPTEFLIEIFEGISFQGPS